MKSIFIIYILLFCSAIIPATTAAETYLYSTQWGSNGSEEGQFFNPSGVAVDGAGNVYVADTGNHRVQKFSSEGNFIVAWGSRGSNNGQFKSPYGIAVDSTGDVYVADYGNYRIQKFSSNGTFQAIIGGSSPSSDGLAAPVGVAVDTAKNIYVIDLGFKKVVKYSSLGSYLTYWDGYFSSPRGIAVDNTGNVYVADAGAHEIFKFSSYGLNLGGWGGIAGQEDGLMVGPFGVTADGSGDVYVSDTYNGRIQKFSPTGTFLTKWGSGGSGDGQLGNSYGIAVDNAKTVYVADTGNHRIQKFVPSTGNETPTATQTGSPTPTPTVSATPTPTVTPTPTITVTPTHIAGPIEIIAPATINNPGEYRLINDVANCSTDCIVIRASNVVLDGGGHTLGGSGFGAPVGNDPRTLKKGIVVDTSSGVRNVILTNLSVRDFGVGIYLNHVQDGILEQCHTSNGFIGILFCYSSNVTIRSNHVDNNTAVGIDSEWYSSNIPITNNIVERNDAGISLHESKGDIRVLNNSIRQNKYGIRSYYEGEGTKSWGNVIRGNRIAENEWGIYGVLSTTVTNNLFHNTVNIGQIGASNVWNSTLVAGQNIINGPYLGGNYWSQTNGSGFSDIGQDADHDGICDTPYSLASGNVDYYPLFGFDLMVIPGATGRPGDFDGDRKYEDINGNGRKDFADIVLYFTQMTWIGANEPLAAFDYNGNGRIDFADVTWLFTNL
jgi:parallel beta-helix repeat protein